MSIIVFTANVENGVIKVPKEYQTQLYDTCRVIVIHDKESDEVKPSRKNQES